jgi:hypothetical protein
MDLFLSAILCFNTKLIREKKDCKQADHSELIAIGKNTRFFFPHSKKSHKETSGIVLTKGGGGEEITRVKFCPREKNLKYTSLTPLRANLKCGGHFFVF